MLQPPVLRSVVIVNGSYGAGANNIDVSKYFAKLPWLKITAIAWEIARTAGSSTTDGKTQTCLDGTNYRDGDSFTQISAASGGQVMAVTKAAPVMRFVATMGSGTTSTVKVWLIGHMVGPLAKIA
jgi:hypothetical protein